jgi:hypothetical protein
MMAFRSGKPNRVVPKRNEELGCVCRRNGIMRKTFGLIGLGGRTVLPCIFAFTAACLLSVSSAQAGIVWDSGTGPVNPPISSGSATAANAGGSATTISGLTFSVNGNASKFDGAIVTVTITAATGYNLNGLTANFSIGTFTSISSMTVTPSGSGYVSGGPFTITSSGSTVYTTSMANLTSGNSESLIFTLGGALGGSSGSFGFSDININATSVVPEPITYALAVFGLIFVGGSAGRFYLARRRPATAS